MKRLLILTALVLGTSPLPADPILPPPVINYQGRVMQNGTNFNGTGHFKFMLLNQAVGFSGTNRIVWKNDGTLTNDEPSTSVQVTVQDGQFTVPLGNTGLAGMVRALPADAFGPPPGASTSDSAGLSLRIWFRPTATGTFTQFTPDVSVNSVPFAFSARAVAGKAAEDLVTRGDVIEILTTRDGPVSGSTNVVQSVAAQHNVAGIDFFRAPIRLARGGTDWSCAVLSSTDASVSFFDFNDGPDALTRRLMIRDNVGGFTKLSGPTDMLVFGDLVYVTSGAEDAVTLLSYEGTSGVATLRAELVDGVGGLENLNDASAVALLNGTPEVIAVASLSTDAISLIRISGNTGVLQSVITAASLNLTGFDGPAALSVQQDNSGRDLLYAACPSTNAIFAFDVSAPTAPVLRWTKTNVSSGFSAMTGPARFATMETTLRSPYLAVVCPTGQALILVDPATGTARSSIRNGVDGFNNLLSPSGVVQKDGMLLIGCRNSGSLIVADVSDTTRPRFVQALQDGVGGFTTMGGCTAGFTDAPLGGGTVRFFILAETESALTVTNTSASGISNQVSLTTSGNIGAGTRRPRARIEAFQSLQCVIRAATGSAGDAVLQLYEYEPVNEEIPFGYEWRYDGGTDVLNLNATGFAGNTGTKATFTKTGNMTLQGTLTQGSDRARKENVTAVDAAGVLEKVAALPVSEWNYIGEGGVRHVGPMSQDFHAAFGLGDTDKGIAAVDADGVALTAIKALKAELDALKRENAEMRTRLEQLEAGQGQRK